MKTVQLIGITAQELTEAIKIDFQKELEVLKQGFQPKEPKQYLTRTEVAKLLSVDISTVHNWTKKGKLVAYGLGNRVYYLRSEVEASIKKLKN